MLTRRRFLGYSALTPAMLAYRPLLGSVMGQPPRDSSHSPIRLAVLGNTYHYGSCLQTITDRFLVGYPHEGDWHMPNVQVVSMYLEPKPGAFTEPAFGPGRTADAKSSPDVLSEGRSKEFGFRLCSNIPEALRCGTDKIAVDAVLVVLEQGEYPRNDRDQILYPRFDFFQQCTQVFEAEGRAVPYFNHESLSFSFQQAKSMITSAERLNFPLLAGSSLPVTWRMPDVDIPMNAQIEEAVMVGVGSFDGMDFDALEAMQCMLERRKGGETGVKAVQLLEGDAVWAAGDSGRWSKLLLSSALSRSDAPQGLTVLDGRPQDMAASGVLPQLVKNPKAYCIEYNDGTHATLLMIDGADADFTFAARIAGNGLVSTQFFISPTPNVDYSACLAAKIEEMYTTRKAPYPAQRTMLTSGMLEACLNSRFHLNQRIETPHLAAVRYQATAESQYART
jgi:hypothetical protein